MDNHIIVESFSLLSKLMDIHGENSFKSKSYSSAAFAIEKLSEPLSKMTPIQIAGIKGVGTSSASKIAEILETGKLSTLEKLIMDTPPGVLEMISIKGLGPKKIHSIWKEMGIESTGELLYACKENRLKLYKGFGEKTQQQIAETIEFYHKNKESHLFANIEPFEPRVTEMIEAVFGKENVRITGKFARQLETLEALEYVVAADNETIGEKLGAIEGLTLKSKTAENIYFQSSAGVAIIIYPVTGETIGKQAVLLACSDEFADALDKITEKIDFRDCKNEESFFRKAGISPFPAWLREFPGNIEQLVSGNLPELISETDIRGLIHCHSTWSDGSNSIEELAHDCIRRGFEYMVISDHSKSAFYAQGLTEDRIRDQHREIETLNRKLAPFRIFSSIECDILNDGSLDYSDSILSTFDLVIASVHSNLRMNEEKAMMRLLKAIENPYTSILGHMTGRLLLSRSGYPVNHHTIIDACAANNVVIELNANPNRLDIDWRHIPYAIEKGVMISINPDAHSIEGISDIRFGVLQARKALVTKKMNLSSFSLAEMEEFVSR